MPHSSLTKISVAIVILLTLSGCTTFLGEPTVNCPQPVADTQDKEVSSLVTTGTQESKASRLTTDTDKKDQEPAISLITETKASSNLSTDGSGTWKPLSFQVFDEENRGHKFDRENRSVEIDVLGGNLSFDHNKVYRRVEELVGAEVEPPSFIFLDDSRYSGSAVSGSISLRSGMSDRKTESVLAHEYFHTIQMERFPDERLSRNIGGDLPLTVDEAIVRRSVFEGSAKYVQLEYVDKHLGGTDEREVYRNYNYLPCDSPYSQYFISAYHFGFRYFDSRIDSSNEVWEVYENPPKSTEQIIHDYDPGEENVANLSTRAKDSSRYIFTSSDPTDYKRMGELLLRTTLRTRLERTKAIDGAAGWGNDHLLEFSNRRFGNNDFAWVIRMDNKSEASELEDSFKDFTNESIKSFGKGFKGSSPDRKFTKVFWEAKTRDGDTEFRVERADDRTVVVFAGSSGFVDSADVRISGKEVVISISESD